VKSGIVEPILTEDSDDSRPPSNGFSSMLPEIVVAGAEVLIIIGALTAAAVYKGLVLSLQPSENWKLVVGLAAAVSFGAILAAAVFYLIRRRIALAVLQVLPAVLVLVIIVRILA
jgi:hypothetical protein